MFWLISKAVSAQQAWSKGLKRETGVAVLFMKVIPGSGMVCEKVWRCLRARLTPLIMGWNKGEKEAGKKEKRQQESRAGSCLSGKRGSRVL